MAVLTPPETIIAAMPGTLAEIADRSGFSVAVVLANIARARVDGLHVRATMQPPDIAEHRASTIFIVDDPVPQEYRSDDGK